ncbi:Unknown protein, partial [Striga hermonthica]
GVSRSIARRTTGPPGRVHHRLSIPSWSRLESLLSYDAKGASRSQGPNLGIAQTRFHSAE